MLINSLVDAPPASMEGSVDEAIHQTNDNSESAGNDPFSDVFESDQTHTSTSDLAEGTVFLDGHGSNTAEPSLRSGFSATEVSDVPRLQAIHSTAGYRDGLSTAKEKFVQEGFDEGFALGAELGRIVGYLLGVLEAVQAALERATRTSGAVIDPRSASRMTDLLKKAREELDLRQVFGETYFGQDGLWKYPVHNTGATTAENQEGEDTALRDSEDADEDLTFDKVARAHPLVLKWRLQVESLATEADMDLDRIKAVDAASG